MKGNIKKMNSKNLIFPILSTMIIFTILIQCKIEDDHYEIVIDCVKNLFGILVLIFVVCFILLEFLEITSDIIKFFRKKE